MSAAESLKHPWLSDRGSTTVYTKRETSAIRHTRRLLRVRQKGAPTRRLCRQASGHSRSAMARAAANRTNAAVPP
ncbi:hypothetical protein AAFF_G00032520 [Aldrovandia affinis]|uniref:Uncharacterized protein n=1 Tax=Aldrovandia affinis TaxID=143900 RepID=A0AAD7WG37_9TELE|nr:hypothetical protein AAFF_G00032520 [Aldrovandia affinis]